MPYLFLYSYLYLYTYIVPYTLLDISFSTMWLYLAIIDSLCSDNTSVSLALLHSPSLCYFYNTHTRLLHLIEARSLIVKNSLPYHTSTYFESLFNLNPCTYTL